MTVFLNLGVFIYFVGKGLKAWSAGYHGWTGRAGLLVSQHGRLHACITAA